MARIARLVIPNLPHHITQRGNGGQKVFYSDADYIAFRDLLSASCKAAKVSCWAFALMPTHIQAILIPKTEDGLRAALAPVHRRYAGMINARNKKTGHFWQGRYGAAVMDESHLLAAFHYILRTPVEAGLADTPAKYKWSSAAAYLKGIDDGLTNSAPMLRRLPDIKSFLTREALNLDELIVRDDETIGRPRGDEKFIRSLERKTGRDLMPEKRGPKPMKKK